MDALWNDLRYALRQLRKTPVFSGVAIATLAIGIGATTAIFSTINATLLRPLPFPQPDRLVDVHTRLIDGRVTTGLLSAVEIEALRALPSVVASVGGFSNQTFEATYLRDDGTPLELLATGVTEGFFDTLGMLPVRGRTFTHDEHKAIDGDAPMFGVLSDRAWSTLFGRDPSVVGKPIRIAEIRGAVTITGIAPAALDLPLGTDLWVNIRSSPTNVAHIFLTVARLQPDMTIDRLRGVAALAMAGLARTIPSDVGREYLMRPLLVSLVGDLRPTLI